MQDEVVTFLANLAPFSTLPEAELKQIRESLSAETYSSGHHLSVQGRTKLDHIYLIKDGLLELFYESDSEKELSGTLGPGEIFGGISILMNAGISVRSVKLSRMPPYICCPKMCFWVSVPLSLIHI